MVISIDGQTSRRHLHPNHTLIQYVSRHIILLVSYVIPLKNHLSYLSVGIGRYVYEFQVNNLTFVILRVENLFNLRFHTENESGERIDTGLSWDKDVRN